jgi:hypothetical protein
MDEKAQSQARVFHKTIVAHAAVFIKKAEAKEEGVDNMLHIQLHEEWLSPHTFSGYMGVIQKHSVVFVLHRIRMETLVTVGGKPRTFSQEFIIHNGQA